MPGTCLIAGCGYSGTRLARRLKAQGPVLGLVRSEHSERELLREGIPARSFDFDRAAAGMPLDLPAALSSVVYLTPPSEQGPEDLRLGRFLQVLEGTHPNVLIYLSTTGVYGDTGGTQVDEQSPAAPREERSRRRLDAEQRAACWCAARGGRCVIFRVPAIYGPWRLPLDRLRRCEPVLRTEDSGPGNRIHVDDLVEACLAALARPVTGIFNLVDGCPESMAEFTIRVATLAGLPLPPQIPWDEARRVLSPGLWSFLRESRRVTCHRTEELGWRPGYADPDAGIRASLLEMGWSPAMNG